MSKQQRDGILQMMAGNPFPTNATPETMRAWVEEANSHAPAAENVSIRRVKCGPCEGDLIVPAGGDASRLIIFFHGGGFVFGSSRTHRVTASHLARAAGCAVLVPDYRLAPENPAPAAHDDAFAVYQWALREGYAPDRVALSGNSAGGNLSLDTALRAQAAGLPLPSALALMSPWLRFRGRRRLLSGHAGRSDLFRRLARYLQAGLSRRRRSQIRESNSALCGLERPSADIGACWELGNAARQLGHHRQAPKSRRRRGRTEDLRRHVPYLANVRPDARRRHGVDRRKRRVHQGPTRAT